MEQVEQAWASEQQQQLQQQRKRGGGGVNSSSGDSGNGAASSSSSSPKAGAVEAVAVSESAALDGEVALARCLTKVSSLTAKLHGGARNAVAAVLAAAGARDRAQTEASKAAEAKAAAEAVRSARGGGGSGAGKKGSGATGAGSGSLAGFDAKKLKTLKVGCVFRAHHIPLICRRISLICQVCCFVDWGISFD
jgi:hypothetical protein